MKQRRKHVKKKVPAPSKALLKVFANLELINESIHSDHAIEILALCPTGSVFESLIRMVSETTDLPPSIAFFALASNLGAALTQNGFSIQIPNGPTIYPNLWLLCLAVSGAGKTYSRTSLVDPLTKITNVKLIPETITAAALFDFFSREGDDLIQRTAGLLVRDEVGELFKKMKTDSGEELKDYLLRSFDGGSLSRATKKEGQATTGKLRPSFFGTSVDTTFFKNVMEEDFENGLMQRFLLTLCKDRPIWRKSLYTHANLNQIRAKFETDWIRILAGPKSYTVSARAIEIYDEWFQRRIKSSISQESYLRRYAFASFRYALIFSIVGDADGVVSGEVMGRALAVIDRHLRDLHTCLIDYTSVSEWHFTYSKVIRRIKDHPHTTRGELITFVRGVGSSKSLQVFLETAAEQYFGEKIGETANRLLVSQRSLKKPII